METMKSKFQVMQELTNKLTDNFPDECQGVIEYLELSEKFKTYGDHKMASFMKEMAKDEYSHAKCISKFLKDNDITMTDEDKKLWEKADAMIMEHKI